MDSRQTSKTSSLESVDSQLKDLNLNEANSSTDVCMSAREPWNEVQCGINLGLSTLQANSSTDVCMSAREPWNEVQCGINLGLSTLQANSSTDVCMSERLIPSRGTCNEVSKAKLTSGDEENWAPKNEYQEVLSQNVLGKESLANTKVLSYQHKPKRQDPAANEYAVLYSSNRDSAAAKAKAAKSSRVLQQSSLRVLDAPGMVDDFYNHPIDWSARNEVAITLQDQVFLFGFETGEAKQLLQLESGNVTTLRWTGEGHHLAVGTSSGEIQIWDAAAQRQLRSLRSHGGRIGALAWNEYILSSGSEDKEIHNHDVRVKEHLQARLNTGHSDLICGLDYSVDGVLASGGNDNAVCIWDKAESSKPLYTFTEHEAAVKALRWCPWQRNVLATGGGSADRQVCLWNASSGRLLMSADAASQVTGIVWGRQERELLTSHGYSRNQLSLWKYPALVKAADLEGHDGRILGISQSPDGALVCSTGADETLRFWQVFSSGDKKLSQAKCGPTSALLRTIR
eukprot:TRINITY_DN4622_c0_g1_i1.p1 TRINITY_DN4622_c0_g1~~TRINITY_DN4622_c0_g1_i1.p1  ORF type:complete len:537 (+),score=88.64 TRINITY_DN4622_c0_g1_i1:78-1613(+)